MAKTVNKNICYYSDCRVREPIFSTVRRLLTEIGLPIVSVTLNQSVPEFGYNIVVEGTPGYPMMVRQIVTALEHSQAEVVWFCENDILYHSSHFLFDPPRDDTFYYNVNVYRWKFGADTAITYDELKSLSGLCCYRDLALEHFRARMKAINMRLAEFDSREPRLPRIWGYEPGTKPRRRGGFSDGRYEVWWSPFPNVDIRHNRSYSPPKVRLEDFKHKPTGWHEVSVEEIPGWDLQGLFSGVAV